MFTGGGETAPGRSGEDPAGEAGAEREAPGHDPPGDDPHSQDGVPAGRQRHHQGATRCHERYGNYRRRVKKKQVQVRNYVGGGGLVYTKQQKY